MTLDDVLTGVLQREGWPKLSNETFDTGGLTKGGVTLMSLSRFLGRRATAQELIDLSETDARALYAKGYAEDPGLTGILSPPLLAFMVDYAVHSGAFQAISDLQRVVGDLTIDGVCGGATIMRTNAADAEDLLMRLIVSRSKFLHRLALHDSDVLAFLDAHPHSPLHNLNGWNNRILEFLHG